MKKLDMRGVAHDVLAVLFVVVFAIAGVGYLVASHADPCSKMHSWAREGCLNSQRAKPVTTAAAKDTNPNGCPDLTRANSQATSKGRWPLHEYAQVYDHNTVQVDAQGKVSGTMLKDHIYTLTLNNKKEALQGFCQRGDHGWVYKSLPKNNATLKAVPLYQYFNSATNHHYYSTKSMSFEALNTLTGESGWSSKSTVAYVSDTSVASGPDSTRPLYQVHNSTTHSYYYSGDLNALGRAINVSGYDSSSVTPAFYVWNDPSSDSSAAAKAQVFKDIAPLPAAKPASPIHRAAEAAVAAASDRVD